jgi:hypothetical protein
MMGFSFMLLVWPSFTCKLIIKVSLGPSNMLGDQVKKKEREICIYPLNQGFVLF